METRDTGTQHKLRMPPELKEKLFASAKDMNRSLNAEIVARLEKSFESFTTESVDFAHGYLSAYLRMQTAIYYHAISDLEKEYKKNPSPEVVQELKKYKVLLDETHRLIEQHNNDVQRFNGAQNKEELLSYINELPD
ncbi:MULTISPECIES: Arc family DNA-binding protein [Acinetobacter]|uniref:Arc family DNA-binding protein n=1 Tax=Acinetobacter TaxID=469 RepID=UPI0021CD76BC|nr:MULTISPECIES: Arc family DNA-binding protein [Acinetobacter]MCU4601708.1 Arc family DNA-binding protein [Acinetobacter ursingii]MEB8380695.1 Arc family DNA-binding protein [Acinetobacter junii]